MRRGLGCILIAGSLLSGAAIAQETPIASDYEIASIRKQLAREKDPVAQFSGYLNLGDQLLSRQQRVQAIEAFQTAFDSARNQRHESRLRSQMSEYAVATAYQGLASAKLGRTAETFDLFEEAVRYRSDSDKIWNLYASSMLVLGEASKAVDAGRNAVTIAAARAQRRSAISDILDLAVDRYTLASALLRTATGPTQNEAMSLLDSLLADLQAPALAGLRKQIARGEMFEVYSTTRSDESTYIALTNRSRLLLGSIYENRSQPDRARHEYEEILRVRSDDPVALQRLAVLAATAADRRLYFQKAFEANPFSPELLLDYERYLAGGGSPPGKSVTTGGAVRDLIEAIIDGRYREATTSVMGLEKTFPGNESLFYIEGRIAGATGNESGRAQSRAKIHDADLREALDRSAQPAALPALLSHKTGIVRDPSASDLASLVQLLHATPTAAEMSALDQLTLSSRVTMDAPVGESPSGTTTFGSGTIGALHFRFSQPSAFRGDFHSAEALRLEFRVLGVTEVDGREALLLEPLRLERE